MIKRFIVLIGAGTVLMYGCTKEKKTNDLQPSDSVSMAGSSSFSGYNMRGSAFAGYSSSIPVDSANLMIGSYLTSINYPATDSGLRSLSFSADSMRAYLSNPAIKTVKFMLAHQPDYINSGHYGQYAGMKPAALTVVIAATDANGTFILNNQNEVYEHCAPCPVICRTTGDAYIY